MKIGIDLDETLIKDPMGSIVQYAEKELNKKSPLKKISNWTLNEFSSDFKKKFIELFQRNDYMNSKLPIEGAIEKLQEWHNKSYYLIIITARQESIREGTIKMVNRYFPMIDKLYFVDFNKSKKDIMKKTKIDVWIDDAPHGVIESYKLGIKTFLISNDFTLYNKKIISKLPIFVIESINKIEL